MRVVLDSNVLISALISPHGPPHRIYLAWREKRFELFTCPEQLDELRRASRYPKLRSLVPAHSFGALINLLQRATIFEGFPAHHEATDPWDAYLLDLSEAASADYLVTGDKRAGLLQRGAINRSRILTAKAFCEVALGQREMRG
jgi:uncharacterized protein